MGNMNALFRGMMEHLPPDGSVLTEEKREDFVELFRLSMKLSYRSAEEEAATTPPPARAQLPAPTAPQAEADVVELDARPTRFSKKLSARKAKPKPKPKALAAPKEIPAPSAPTDARRSNGKLTARDVILQMLAASAKAMSAKMIVAAAEDDRALDLSGFKNLPAAVAAQLARLEQSNEVVLTDMVGNAKYYTIAGRQKF
jgi:hypothetical protein